MAVGGKEGWRGERDTRVEGHMEELKVCICCFFVDVHCMAET